MKAWILRHGRGHEVCEANRLLNTEYVSINVGSDEYRVRFAEKMESWNHLVVIDGVLLPHGLPRSARCLANVTTNAGTWYDGEVPERLIASSSERNVKRSSGLPSGAELLTEPDMFDYHKVENGIVTVTFARWFLSLQKRKDGERALFFRYKPRSLERNYVLVTSLIDEVKFQTLNDW